MTDLRLITTVLSRHADWKLKRSFSGQLVYTKNETAQPNDATRIYYATPLNVPDASEETLQLLAELGIE